MTTGTQVEDPQAVMQRLSTTFSALRDNLAKVIVGQEEATEQLVVSLLCSGHVLMVGVPGLAKTLMIRALAQALGWKFHRIQFTPDLMPTDITGTEILQADAEGARRELVFHRGPIFANLILADEINRTPPKTQAALLEAMQERAVTVNGTTYDLAHPFVVVATQNPIEQEGTYPLPEAQLDRFMLSIHMTYPTREQEKRIAALPPRMQLPEMQRVAEPKDFAAFTQLVDDAPVSDVVLDYAVNLAAATRPTTPGVSEYVKQYVAWGVGPRGTQHLITTAKAAALLDGRPAAEVQDVKKMALPVLRHRLSPNYNAMGEGLDASDIVRELLERVPVPTPAGR